jgi:flavin-binding protein dodecin
MTRIGYVLSCEQWPHGHRNGVACAAETMRRLHWFGVIVRDVLKDSILGGFRVP